MYMSSSNSLHAVAAVRPLHGRVLFLGRSCFPVTRTPLPFTRSYSHISNSWSSEHTYIPGLRHLSSGRVRNEQHPPKGQAADDDSDAANALCSPSDPEAASHSAESSSVLPGSASSVINGGTSPLSSGLSVDSTPDQLSAIAPSSRPPSSVALDSDTSSAITENSLAREITVDAVSDISMAKNEAPDGAQHKPSRPCLACGSPDHLIRDCPDRAHIKPNVRCRRCGSSDHWLVDCTASSKVQSVYRTACSICGKKGHLAHNCPNRAQHKPSRPCAACGSPDHWMYDCPDRTHIKPKGPCGHCGSRDHWAVDCTASIEERKAYRTRCPICRRRGHTAHDCTDRAEHKPLNPCPVCGSPDHWAVDCPAPAEKRKTYRTRCPICGQRGHTAHDCTDRAEHKPLNPCPVCGSPDHWAVDCTAPVEKQKAYRTRCPICGEKGHLGRNCPNRAQHKPRHRCPACDSPDHWMYDCPDRTHIKPKIPCGHCGSLDHWAVDCTASIEERKAYRGCTICGQKGHTGSNCPDRAAHKPSKPCPVCGSLDHWLYDCPEKDKTPGFELRECAHCGGLHVTSQCRKMLANLRLRRARGNAAKHKI